MSIVSATTNCRQFRRPASQTVQGLEADPTPRQNVLRESHCCDAGERRKRHRTTREP
ncbi:MAG: hypothetical protein PUJ57_06570 [Peptoniphilaceae bacterium]|nr:hypothetical protein [Peptoniphilaceae bacterium]MDY6085280.1 hypothetical protein [Peptoniphilaceae bacterium]